MPHRASGGAFFALGPFASSVNLSARLQPGLSAFLSSSGNGYSAVPARATCGDQSQGLQQLTRSDSMPARLPHQGGKEKQRMLEEERGESGNGLEGAQLNIANSSCSSDLSSAASSSVLTNGNPLPPSSSSEDSDASSRWTAFDSQATELDSDREFSPQKSSSSQQSGGLGGRGANTSSGRGGRGRGGSSPKHMKQAQKPDLSPNSEKKKKKEKNVEVKDGGGGKSKETPKGVSVNGSPKHQ